MTTLTYTEHKGENLFVKVSLDGHADFNPGNDIVCAGISTITFQMIGMLEELAAEGSVTYVTNEIRPGHTMTCFRCIDEDKWHLVWRVIKMGYECIAENYPEHLHIADK